MKVKKSVKKQKIKLNSPKNKNIARNRWVVISVALLIIIALFLIIGPYFTGRVISDPEGQAFLIEMRKAGVDNPIGLLDIDRDGLFFTKDNCPSVSNRGQQDTDKDGVGDRCDVYDNRSDKNYYILTKTTLQDSRDYDKDGIPDMVDSIEYGRHGTAVADYVFSKEVLAAMRGYWNTQVRIAPRTTSSASPSPTKSASPTPSGSASPSPTASASPSPTESATPSPQPTGTASPSPSGIPE